ncbi:myo-inositol-1(or 4)-monophosphatase [Frondihabitans sp. PhB188]|uniref:inositol monophosphatase family protein n=1 Tax=Frondihabitans sp. PhB188 TaxID=2485200 RepID=UPI000F47E580|nr:inositol monophosphatase family protein [Frondihabitans sp. PhB188]ROQ39407.1 myo-inositol-1(or 4)-monophosphatase [Frondihabitans sp. PhB188]
MTTNAELLETARSIAREAGELAARRRAQGVEVAASKSSSVDIVTHADREVEALIRARLAAERPGDGFYGEESGAEPTQTGLTWIVDPIDGTVNFLYGIPAYAVSIAVVEGEPDPLTWRALAACVFNPVAGEEYVATRGGGAFLNSERLAVSRPADLSQSLLATGFSYDPVRRIEQGAVVAPLLGRVRDIRRIGAASLDLCSVAAGRLDAYVERGLQPWDHAAGVLVAGEAGATVLTPAGAQASRDLTFVCAPTVAAELAEALADVGF